MTDEERTAPNDPAREASLRQWAQVIGLTLMAHELRPRVVESALRQWESDPELLHATLREYEPMPGLIQEALREHESDPGLLQQLLLSDPWAGAPRLDTALRDHARAVRARQKATEGSDQDPLVRARRSAARLLDLRV